jgi:hypothetical protein
MPYHLFRAVVVTALAGVCCLLPACRSDLSPQSTLYVVVHDEQLAALMPVLEQNGATVRGRGDDGWEIRNDAESRSAFETLLGIIDQEIDDHRGKLAAAYEQSLVPGGPSRYANQCLQELGAAHRKRCRVAVVLEQMDPERLGGAGRTAPARSPDGSWRPVAAFYDARLPLPRACSVDELIHQASTSALPQAQGRRLVAVPAGPPVASR